MHSRGHGIGLPQAQPQQEHREQIHGHEHQRRSSQIAQQRLDGRIHRITQGDHQQCDARAVAGEHVHPAQDVRGPANAGAGLLHQHPRHRYGANHSEQHIGNGCRHAHDEQRIGPLDFREVGQQRHGKEGKAVDEQPVKGELVLTIGARSSVEQPRALKQTEAHHRHGGDHAQFVFPQLFHPRSPSEAFASK